MMSETTSATMASIGPEPTTTPLTPPAAVTSPILPIQTIESSPDSDATMLQALDAAAANSPIEGEEGMDDYNSDQPLTSVDSFEKTLQSDVNENQALLLLCDVQPCDEVFSVYTGDDLERLARYLSVLSFDTGEHIISKGEPASFCGIVLSGCFHAIISETTTIPLTKGALVGEMSFFEGGKRTADIISAEPSVLAVISFSDLRKLQPLESELVSKFLHMLAVVSIRKLRNMMKPPPTASSAPIFTIKPASSTAEKKDDATAAPSATSPTNSAATTPAAPSNEPLDAQESLFKYRLKKKEMALEQNEAKLEEAKKAAEALKRSKELAQKKGQAAKYKATALENKLKANQKEKEELNEQIKQLKETIEKSKTRNQLLQSQLVATSQARERLEQQLTDASTKYASLDQDRDDLSRGTSLMIANLEMKLEQAQKANIIVKGNLDAEMSKVKLLTTKFEEAQSIKDEVELEHKSLVRSYEILKNNNMIANERANTLDQTRKELLTRLNEEELSHVAWKSKADLYLGDYTRLTARMKDMELEVKGSIKDRRAALRKIKQLSHLIKQMVVRAFVKAVRSRKLILAILKRVNLVVTTTRIEQGGGNGDDSGTFSLADGSTDDTLGSQSQFISPQQSRKDRLKFLNYLKVDRTPISKLVWVLDEELTQIEQPFQILQTENIQLRHTLDSFFKRNIQLCQQFLQAKTTYEALFREYSRLKDTFEKLKRKERAATAATLAAAGQTTTPSTNVYNIGRPSAPVVQPLPTQLEIDSHSSDYPTFASSLPTPTPFSPASLAPLSSGQLHSYAAAFGSVGLTPASPNHHERSPDLYSQISLTDRAVPTPVKPIAPSPRKGKHGSTVVSVEPSPSATPDYPSRPNTAGDIHPRSFSPHPPGAGGSGNITPTPTLPSSRVSGRPVSSQAHSSHAHPSPPAYISTYNPHGPTSPTMVRPVTPVTTWTNGSGGGTAAISYDISMAAAQRNGGGGGSYDLASRSEALRHQIQTTLYTKGVPSNSKQSQQQYPHAYQRSPGTPPPPPMMTSSGRFYQPPSTINSLRPRTSEEEKQLTGGTGWM